MEFKENQPIYIQIAFHICEHILLKKWKVEDRIPSVREIAEMMEVNPNTTMRAYSFLQDEGIIYNKRGIGYFTTAECFKKAQALKRQDFIERVMPDFFENMELLELDIKELQALYQKLKKLKKEKN